MERLFVSGRPTGLRNGQLLSYYIYVDVIYIYIYIYISDAYNKSFTFRLFHSNYHRLLYLRGSDKAAKTERSGSPCPFVVGIGGVPETSAYSKHCISRCHLFSGLLEPH